MKRKSRPKAKHTSRAQSEPPSWNLRDLYRGLKDPAIQRTLQGAKRAAEKFNKRYHGKLEKLVRRPRDLHRILKEYERILTETAKPATFAGLLFAQETRPEHGALLQGVRGESLLAEEHVAFLPLELASLPAVRLVKMARARELLPYQNFLRQLLRRKKYFLSELEEKLDSAKSVTGSEAFSRLFDEELSAKRFKIKNGRKIELKSAEELLSGLYVPNRVKRKESAKAFTDGLKEESRRLTYIFNILGEDKATSDRYRKLPTPEESMHLYNSVTQEMVDVMSDVVESNYRVVQDFYNFKKKLLGLPKLHEYDRYAPLGTLKRTVSWDEAKELVLHAFGAFSPHYREVAALFFDKNWIDAAPRPGKRTGAFCSFVTPDRHPYVFQTFTGTLKDVFTLAHELGHATHAYYMREQSYLSFNVPLTIAETASTFAEMLLFESLKLSIRDKGELFSLYVSRIEEMFATVFRQISLYRFEQSLHQTRRKEGELRTERISELWRVSQRKMFGSSVELTPDYDIWWSYIGHFIHSPFYVYSYAFGELLALSLFAKYREGGDSFVPKYTAFLAAGASKSPSELVRPMGIDFTSRGFWENGVRLIQGLVKEAKFLHTDR